MPLGLDVGTLKLMLVAGAVIAAAIFLVAVALDRRGAKGPLLASGRKRSAASAEPRGSTRGSGGSAAGSVEPGSPAHPLHAPGPDQASSGPARPVGGSMGEPAMPLPSIPAPAVGVTLVGADTRLSGASRRLSGGPPPLVTRVPTALSPAMQDRARSAPTASGAVDAYVAASHWTPPRRRPLHSNPRFLAFLAGTTVLATLVLFLGVNLVLFVTSPAPSESTGPANAIAGPSLGAPPSGLETPTITVAPAVERATPSVEPRGTGLPSGAPGATPPLTGGQPPTSGGSPVGSASASPTLGPSVSAP